MDESKRSFVRDAHAVAGAILLAVALLGASPSALAAESVSYDYDALGRVIRVDYVGGPNDGMIIEYTYDATGNRTEVVIS